MQKANIVFITKATGNLSIEEVIKIFESTDDLGIIKNAVESCQERVYATWASVEGVDLDKEIIPIEDIASQQETLLKRNGPIMDNHTNRLIGQTLAYKVLEHPESKTTGVLHLNKIFDDGNRIDNMAWDEIKSGERKGSSVGGYNLGNKPGFDSATGERANILEGFRQMETSSVYDPCNPLAMNIAYAVVAKSNKTLENQEMIIESKGKKIKAKVTYEEIEEDKSCDDKTEKENIKSESVINKLSNIQDIINKTLRGDTKMDETKIEKSLSAITKGIDDISGRLTVLEADKAKADNSEDKPAEDPEEKKKEAPSEDKPKEDEEDKPKEAKKEEAASEVEGNNGKEVPDAPTPDTANDERVFKKLETMSANIEKRFKNIEKGFVAKASTPLPSQPKPSVNDNPMANAPLDIALKGKIGDVKATWGSVHRAVKSQKQNMPTPFGGL